MLDFFTQFFKRQPDLNKHVSSSNATQKNERDSHVLEDKKKKKEQERIHFLKKIEEISQNEQALIELVLHCDFADGRFQAAQYVYSRNGLEEIKNALRNTDKRVVKLMQSRLDAIQKSEQEHYLACACIANAEQLLKQDQLVLNQVIDLDKQAATLVYFPEEFASQFKNLRQQLAQQLDVQQNLQRRLLDILQTPDWCLDENLIEKKEELEEKLKFWQLEINAIIAHEKILSVPKNLLQEVHHKLQKQTQILASAVMQKAKLDNNYSQFDTAASNEINKSTNILNNDEQYSGFGNKNHIKQQLNSDQIEALLSQFESSIEQGSMQKSRQFERELREIKLESAQLNTVQKDRLHQARYVFNKMQSLAQWSSDISRNELVATAESLATLHLDAQELVSTVTALRKQWKQLEQTGGSVSKEMWEKFDLACNHAYAPAAQHFQELDQQREQNLLKAEEFLLNMQTQIQALLKGDEGTFDWKKIHHTIFQFQQDWKKLGLIDRKHLSRIKNQFELNLKSLRVPLETRQQEELRLREQLIEQANKVEANQRQAVEQIRSLQERWKLQAQQIPLRRQDEQILWDQFRTACDAVFAKRKQFAELNDAQRLENLKNKIHICERLESSTDTDIQELNGLINVVTQEWKEIGSIPREQDSHVERRYQLAVQAVNEKIQHLKAKDKQLQSEQLLRKIVLCQALEKVLISAEGENASNHSILEKIYAEWDQISSILNKNKWHGILNTRFKSAQSALANNDNNTVIDTSYTLQFQKNISAFDEIVLHAEILVGVESPAELANQRLQKQVEVLQSSMKNGQNKEHLNNLVTQLIAMPVELDASRHQRMLVLLERVGLEERP